MTRPNSYLLQIASASSEPSAHSGSPSQRQRAGTHWPFLQAKSVVAHVFFAAETKQEGKTQVTSKKNTARFSGRGQKGDWVTLDSEHMNVRVVAKVVAARYKDIPTSCH